MKKSELKQLIKEVLREELENKKHLKEEINKHNFDKFQEYDENEEYYCNDCGQQLYDQGEIYQGIDGELYCDSCWGENFFFCDNDSCDHVGYHEDSVDTGDLILCSDCAEAEFSNEVLDVAASEVDDLARDVFLDSEFESAYKADNYTVGEAVEALIIDVISSEYPNADLGNVPERVSDALSNMLDSGLLG